MTTFQIEPSVTCTLPTLQVVVVTARVPDNQGANENVSQYAEDTAKATLATLSKYPNAQSHPRIAHYRDTLKARCNVSAKKFPQSNESLYKRLMKLQGPLPSINPLVDFYNSVSIQFAVTVGAFDIDSLKGQMNSNTSSPSSPLLVLRKAKVKSDTFLALDAPPGSDGVSVSVEELVYAQGSTILTRHLAWRQAMQGLVTPETKEVVFVAEIINDETDLSGPSLVAQAVLNQVVTGLRNLFQAEIRHSSVLGVGMACMSSPL